MSHLLMSERYRAHLHALGRGGGYSAPTSKPERSLWVSISFGHGAPALAWPNRHYSGIGIFAGERALEPERGLSCAHELRLRDAVLPAKIALTVRHRARDGLAYP